MCLLSQLSFQTASAQRFTVCCFRRPGIINVIKIDMKFVRKFDERSKQIMRMLIARQLWDRYLCIPLNRQSEFIEAISDN